VHELGLCEAILEAVENRAQGRRVTGVKVRVGALHRVVEPVWDQAFTLAAAGTVAEGAAMNLEVIPVEVRCRECGKVTSSDDPLAVCPACGGADLDIEGGDELTLESIEVEAPA
jgi:hydrogenase nickel incorporation protein HypA/HybF